MRGWFLALVVALLATSSTARAERPVALRQVTVFDRSRGFPSPTVLALALAPDGHLWAGTNHGLVRFDGARFTVIRRDTHPALPSDYVRSLAFVGDTLWIGTAGGVVTWHAGELAAPVTDARLANARVELVAATRAGVWIATFEKTFLIVNGRIELETDATNQIHETKDGRIWFGKWLRSWHDGAFTGVDGVDKIDAFVDDGTGSAWAIGSDFAYHVGTGERHVLPADFYATAARDPSGTIWLGGRASVLAWRPGTPPQALTRTHGIGGPVEVLKVDAHGDVWVGMTGAALARIRDPRIAVFSTAQGMPSRGIADLVEDREGRVWVATEAGLARIEKDAVTPVDLGPVAAPAALYVDGRDRVWVSLADGLYRSIGGAKLAKVLDAVALYLVDDPGGQTLSVGTPTGTQTLGNLDHTPTNHRLLERTGFVIHHARDGAIWIGTPIGACIIEGTNPTCFTGDDGGPTGLVVAIHEDARGTIWLGTHENGLYRYRDARFRRFGTVNGLPSDTHYVIVDDQRGHLWTTSDVGITRIDVASLEGEGPVRARLFDERDGMRTADCMGGGRDGIRTRDGRLWFSTSDGVAMLDPAIPDPEPPVITARIERVRGDTAIWSPAAIDLRRKTALAIDLATPELRHAENIELRYRVTGVDTDWQTTRERSVRYPSIATGAHRFEVQARVDGGTWGPTATFAITVPAPVWQALWFQLLAAVCVLSFGFAAHRWRLALEHRKRRRLERIVAERTEELAQANATLEQRVEDAVTSLREAERMAAYGHVVAGVAHEVRQPVFALSNAIYVLGKKLTDRPDVAGMLSLAEREGKRINHLMDELLDYSRPPELTPRSVPPANILREAEDLFRAEQDPDRAIDVTIDVADVPPVPMDEARIVQVVVNLMGNAKKHARGVTKIALRARTVEDRLELDVENDGSGIPEDALPRLFEPFYSRGETKGSGLGLAIVHRIVREHSGDVVVNSRDGETRFTIKLPTSPPAEASA